eukprot:evm.model.scf_1815.1 EVM.evm.TU.scf_1815.1   scf_1815:25909-27485(+)
METHGERTGTSWSGKGSQEDFMIRDTCILVDETDAITGHSSKKDCHRFSDSQRGLLHRAFSVFLFNSENRLLLQQRASSKITFPDVWTNTCCSHPLYGFDPPEVDSPADVLSGMVPGVKNAAVRKLGHELGIPSDKLPLAGFRFLTRMHYCAPDTTGAGDSSGWGEHEMDYILFCQGDVDVVPHPDEVQDFKYVNQEELKAMMDPLSGLRWSPWFKLIAKKFLETWWQDLPGVFLTDKYVDVKTIHRLEC